MGAFHVDHVYLVPHQDLLVLAGARVSGLPGPGWSVDLPREVQGPGWVPIHDVQQVPFADGADKFCLILQYAVVEGAPLMEFRDLEGRTLDLRP